jgi:hypothetical protein
MREYDVRIRETLEVLVSVEAGSMAQAQQIAEKNWRNSDYILDASNFTTVSFEALYPQTRDYER